VKHSDVGHSDTDRLIRPKSQDLRGLDRPDDHDEFWKDVFDEDDDDTENRQALSQEVATGNEGIHGQEDEEQRVEEGEEIDEEGEDGRPVKTLTRPIKVTKAMREEHNKTHTPYRSWCKFCVRGRGCSKPHYRKNKTDREDIEEILEFQWIISS
jgi:hypothetical protein